MSPRRFAAWHARLIQHQPRRRLRRNVPLWVERMEDRTLLSAVFTVNTTVDSVDASPGDGVAEDSLERTSLRAAVMEANALAGSDTILVPQGSYDLALTGAESEATNDLDVTSDIQIVTTGGGLTTIDAQGIDRVIHVGPGGSLTLDGVEITGGNTGGSGGGVFNDGGTVDLVDVTVRGNTGTTGGGLANTGELNIDNSTISGNTGGGIHNASAASLAITRSTVTSNTALAGAGIDSDGSAEINNSIVADNTGTNENSDVAGDFTSTGFNLIGKAGAASTGFTSDDFVGTTSIPIDPRLEALAENGGTTMTHALLPGSVAIDGGAAVVDRSGNGITSTIVGDVLAGEGLLGAGASFPGGVNNTSDDFLSVDLDRLPANQIPTSAITVAAWARITQTGHRHEIFASQTEDGDFITHVEVLPDGTARFVLRSDADDTIINFIGGSVPFDTWFHYAATYDEASNQVDVYIDGVSIFSGPATLNLAIGSDWGLGGTIGSTTDNARPFTGQMDEFYLFTRALSSAEITTLATVPANPTGIPQVTGDLSIYYSFDDLITRATDQRSGPRVLDGDGLAGPRIDIGAFERVNDFNPDDPIPEVIQLGNITVNVEQVATGLVSPSLVVNAADGSGRIFISDQIGFVHLVKNGVVQGTPFLDITASITDTLNGNQEVGLSGFAFHPDFSVSGADGFGKFYTLVDELVDELAPVDFTHFPLPAGQDRAAQSVLREYTMNNITDDVFSGTTRELLRIDQPHDAHSAGNVVFGPDKLLYISLGDGGTHDDQGPGHNPDIGNARDLSVVYGKILRIDPFGTNSANGQYGIPANNPFVGDPTALDEILFHGLRNPFRISFETTAAGVITSKLVIGDTGQDDIEEVDRADVFDDAGGHFGWNLKEGTFLFDAGLPPDNPGGEPRIGATADSPGSPLGLIDPIVQYDHGPNGEGTAVIGGETYQGDLIPELKGMYVFGDFNESFAAPTDGRIFYADLDSANPEIFELNLVGQQISLGGGVSMFIKGFGRDENGELYVAGSTTLSSADNSGVVLRLTGTQIQADLSVTTHGDEAGPVDIEYTVMLSVPNTTGAPITFDLDDLLTGTATSGDDYTAIAANAQITVAEGASTGSLTVPVAVDASPEPVETVIAQISNPSHAFVTIGTASATANIANSTVVNLNLGNLNGTTGFQLDGVATDDSSGFSVSGAGDVNGDGFDDVIVGARLADSNGGESGSSYVVFGRSGGFTSPINLSSLNGTTGFRLDGVAADDRSGRSVNGAGDVNGDGIDDLIVGAWNADPNGSASGASYVMFGHSGPFGATIDLSSLNGTTGFRLDGAATDDRSGLSVSSAGDVNGDGFDDVIVGAQLADPNGGNSGSSYVVFGHSGAFSSSINLGSLNGTTGFRLDGAAGNDRAGIWVRSAGDVNGDGFDDVIVGAFQADPNGSDSGSSYVVFGHSGVFAASTNLSTLNGTNGFRLDGVAATDHSGLAVSGAGDVNGDGFDDLLVAARETDHNGNDSGSSYVVFGHSGVFAASTNLSSLNGTTGFRLDGAAAGDFAGFSVSDAGDVNGDGFDDLIVGAFFADPNGDSSGSTYVVYGRSSAFASTINLSSLDATTGFRLDGVAADDRSGVSVSSAGDVNGDGFDDLIIGADQADPNGNSSAGSSYVYFGSSLTGGVETQVGNASADTLTATQGTGIDILIGGQGPDTLISDGGDDVLRGGEDDDTLSIPDTTFSSRRLLGGNGTDTLMLAGSGLTLDLTTLADNRIVDIEEIDITGTGANTLSLDVSAVLNISSHSNTVVVRRNSGDTVNIGSGWTQQTNEVIGLDTFEVFTQGAATLKVQQVVAAITGFTPVGAPGSLIFDPPVNGSISVAGEVDGYTISLDPGQTITVVLTATGSLQGTAEVLDTEGTLLGTSTAPTIGDDVVLQTLTAAFAGTYTLNISGASSTTGDYTVEVILNAALEEERVGGPSNDTLAAAQDIDASFIALGGGVAERGAVLGSSGLGSDDWFSFSVADGQFFSLVYAGLEDLGSTVLELYDAAQTFLATGLTADNIDQVITQFFDSTTDGMADDYFVRIIDPAGQYSLVATLDSDFDSENNNNFDSAQDAITSLGFIQSTAVTGTTVLTDFPGIESNTSFCGCQPPDTHAAVGLNHVVEVVNTAIEIYDKDGNVIAPAQALTSFFDAGLVAGETFDFDPVVAYMEDVDRWVVGVLIAGSSSTAESDFLVAISDSSDPTGGWSEQHRIDFGGVSPGLFADYPKVGWNSDALVFTFNMFGASFVDVNNVAIDKSTVLDANPGTFSHFISERPSSSFTMAAATMHGSSPGDPMWLVEESGFGGTRTNVRVVRMDNILTAAPTYTDFLIPVTAYGSGSNPDAPQPGGTRTTNDARMLNAEWRNNRLVSTHTVDLGGEATVRWYEFDTSVPAAPTLTQQGDVDQGAGVATYFPSIAINAAGDIGLNFMQSSGTEFTSMYVTGQIFGGTPGVMSAPVLAAAGNQTFPGSRSGDYSGITVDPVTDTFWAANEISLDGVPDPLWSTHIAEFAVSPVEDADFYRFFVNSGDNLVATTFTPFDGPLDPANTLDPTLELFSPSGASITFDDNSVGDGRNASLTHTAAQSGEYRLRVGGAGTSSGEYFFNISGVTGTDSGPTVLDTDPDNGATVTAFPITVTVDFSSPILISSVEATDLLIGGLAATGVTPLDGDSFVFTVDPAANSGDATYSVDMAQGAVDDLQGHSLAAALSGTFILDTSGPSILSTSWNGVALPADATIAAGSLTLDVTVSEQLFALRSARTGLKAPGTDDVELTDELRGVVINPDAVDFDPGTLNFSAVFDFLPEGSYTLRLISGDGAFEDLVGNDLDGEPIGPGVDGAPTGDGNPGGDYVLNFFVDAAAPELNPVERVMPLGSLIAGSTDNGGVLHSNADQEDFSIFLESGETLSAELLVDAGVTGTIEIVELSLTASSPAAGQPAVLAPVLIPVDGTYTLRVTASSTTSFNLDVYHNATLEALVGDSELANELDITPSLITLGSGRFAVVGAADVPPQGPLQFNQSNDPAQFIDISGTGTALGLGDDGEADITTTVGNAIFPAGAVTVGNNGGILSGAGGFLPFTNAGLPNGGFNAALLPFWDDIDGTTGDVYWEERQVDGINTLIVQWEDRPHFDNVGSVTFQVQLFESGPDLARFAYEDVVFGDVAFDNGAGATIGYQENSTSAVQFSIDSAVLSNGDVLDLFRPPLGTDVDFYEIDLTGKSGEPIDIVLTGLDGVSFAGETLELLDVNGTTILATGSLSPVQVGTTVSNYDQGILDFIVPADGVYTIRVTSTEIAGDYSVLVTDPLTFDSEPNDDPASNPLRDLTTTRTALGHLATSDDANDFYEITLNANDVIVLTTGTPFDDPGRTPINNLNPELSVLDTNGTTALLSDQDSLDGRNARIEFTAPAAGTFFIGVAATSGAGEYTLHINDVAAPRVMQVLVSSSSWSTEFKDEFLGSTGGFYQLPTDGGQLRTLAWEIDQVRVVFDQNVTISQDDMILTRGSDTLNPVPLQGFAHSGTTATWTIDPVSADKLLLNLNDQTIVNGSGAGLDGEFDTGSGATQSGNGTPGGPFRFRINVLAADVDGSGQVDSGDMVGIGAAFLQTPGDAGWDPFADLDTSAQVDSGDVVPVGAFFLNALPGDEPPEATFPAPLLVLPNAAAIPTAPATAAREPDARLSVGLLESVTVTTVEPQVISPASNQSSTNTTSQVPLMTLGRAGRERSGNARTGNFTVSGKGMSTGQFTTPDATHVALRDQTKERTRNAVKLDRVNTARRTSQSTWIDLPDSVTLSGKADRDDRPVRDGVAWHSFDDDQIKTTIKIGKRFKGR